MTPAESVERHVWRESGKMEAGMVISCPIPSLGAARTYLYVVRRYDTRELKIGVSIDPESRLAGLQTSHAVPLDMVLLLPVIAGVESAIHTRFADERLMGEWFRESPDILAWLADQQAFAATLPIDESDRVRPCAYRTKQDRPCPRPGQQTIRFRVAGVDEPILWSVCVHHVDRALREFAACGLTGEGTHEWLDGRPNRIDQRVAALAAKGDL